MNRILILSTFVLITTLACTKERPPARNVITIVNIGHASRIELGRQIRAIKKHSPKVIGLDFFVALDSADRDSVLVSALGTGGNIVHIVGFHSVKPPYEVWDSVDLSHEKFNIKHLGFVNLSVDDSVIERELPMVQSIGKIQMHSFSYVVAENSFGVKDVFRNTGEENIDFDLEHLGKNYKLVTADELLSGKARAEDFKDRIVLMGYIGDDDVMYINERRSEKVNGVEVHAAFIQELIDLK